VDWLLGTSRYRRGDAQGAVQFIRRAIEGGQHDCWRHAERLFLQNPSPADARAAIALLEPLTETSPAAQAFGRILAFAQSRAGDAESAARIARATPSLLVQDACDTNTWAQALAQNALEDHVDAWFRRAQRLGLGLGETYWLLAEARERAGDIEGAISLARLAIQNHHKPSWAEANWLISAHNALGDPNDTVRRLERIVGRNPQQPVFFALLALAHAQTGAAESAVHAAAQAAALDPRYRQGAAALVRQAQTRLAHPQSDETNAAPPTGQDTADDGAHPAAES
jgi:predicted Zn-dependent protease